MPRGAQGEKMGNERLIRVSIGAIAPGHARGERTRNEKRNACDVKRNNNTYGRNQNDRPCLTGTWIPRVFPGRMEPQLFTS